MTVGSVTPLSSGALVASSREAFDLTQALNAVKEVKNQSEKKVRYLSIFEAVKAQGDIKGIHLVLEQYAAELLYNQTVDGDKIKGFVLSARLMEFSLLVQLKALGLVDQGLILSSLSSISEERNLETLLSRLESVTGLDAFFKPLNFDLEVLKKRAEEQGFKGALKKTLIRLSFSYQNSPKHTADKELQEKVQELTEAVLGEDIKDKVEYVYNRLQFMLVLREPQATLDKKIEAYQIVFDLLKKLPEDDRFRLGKEAQILNFQALNYLRGGGEAAQAKPLSLMAVQKRESLYNSATSPSDKREQSYFFANALTGLLYSIQQLGPSEEEKTEVRRYKEVLETHLKDMGERGDNNTYKTAYENGITTAEKILSSS